MAHRFCTRCNAEVEDVGGYCLLGHNLRLQPVSDSLSALRAEVNRTFDEARDQLEDVLAPVLATRTVVGAPPPPPPEPVLQAPELPVETMSEATNVWDGLDESPSLEPDDPIASFAPSPRMDWGPSRSPRLGLKRSRSPKLQPDS